MAFGSRVPVAWSARAEQELRRREEERRTTVSRQGLVILPARAPKPTPENEGELLERVVKVRKNLTGEIMAAFHEWRAGR